MNIAYVTHSFGLAHQGYISRADSALQHLLNSSAAPRAEPARECGSFRLQLAPYRIERTGAWRLLRPDPPTRRIGVSRTALTRVNLGETTSDGDVSRRRRTAVGRQGAPRR